MIQVEELPKPQASEKEEDLIRIKKHVFEYLSPAAQDKKSIRGKSIFVGGGISNCPDWQATFSELVNQEIENLIKSLPELDVKSVVTLFNPRRKTFPMGDPNVSPFQIKWEAAYLALSQAFSIWFPKDTAGPISLFETGKWIMSSKPCFIGIEPGYPKTEELVAHIKSIRPNAKIVSTLEEHAKNTAKWALGIGSVDLPVISEIVIPNTLYLSGGISNCPDWQARFEEMLSTSPVKVINPRIKNFIKTPESYAPMVRHNRTLLNSSEAAVVWFPKEQLTPIALLELGSLLASSKPVFVGIDQGYGRQIDVEIQTDLARPEIEIAYNLEDLSDQVKRYYRMK